jgi:Na+/H+-dicarboxylate symporter
LYYFVTTFLAVITGIILVVAIKPGKGLDISAAPEAKLSVDPSKVTTTDTMLDLIRYQVLY